MSESASSQVPTKAHRTRYLLDRAAQLSVTWHLLGVLGGTFLLYAVAIFFLMGPGPVASMSADEARSLLLYVHLGYFGLGGAILAVTVLLLTHRFVGPAHVMRTAVEGMRRGDHSHRLDLRKRDYLQALAQELELMRTELADREARMRDALTLAHRRLDAGDERGAREALETVLDLPRASAVPVREATPS
jgi:hypothetical protein